jgi:hypothetical protein
LAVVYTPAGALASKVGLAQFGNLPLEEQD